MSTEKNENVEIKVVDEKEALLNKKRSSKKSEEINYENSSEVVVSEEQAVAEVKAQEPVVEEKSVKETTPQKRWYIVHTYSGHEHKVKANLEKRIEYMNMSDKIFRVEVPQKTITKVKDGRKQDREEKIFPGYVLVEMIMDDDSWYVVRHTASVTKFVGAKRPIPAKDAEIKKILHRSQSQTTKIELDVKVGDKIRIVSGPFADFIGDITEVYPDKSKLRAMVSIFGRETPVELEYKQIQKV
ncbi:transcription termination/antitermination protein NusG [bacterium]|nr:transcription termination/antitermination protein NusG [bacterium]